MRTVKLDHAIYLQFTPIELKDICLAVKSALDRTMCVVVVVTIDQQLDFWHSIFVGNLSIHQSIHPSIQLSYSLSSVCISNALITQCSVCL